MGYTFVRVTVAVDTSVTVMVAAASVIVIVVGTQLPISELADGVILEVTKVDEVTKVEDRLGVADVSTGPDDEGTSLEVTVAHEVVVLV